MPARPEPLLLPANRAFIALTIAAAFALNLLPWGRAPAMPDFLALALAFWNVHQPRKVGIGVGFLTGLLMDVHTAGLLGEHALAYSLVSYGALALHRRVLSFRPAGQMLHVLPLLLAAQAAVVPVRLALGAGLPEPAWFAQSLTTTLLWPLAWLVLLAPQRGAGRDETRPI